MTLATGSTSLGVPTPTQIPGIFTFATLPVLSGTAAGSVSAWTSDAGKCYWNGTGWTAQAVSSFIPSTKTFAGIQAAIAAAALFGGIVVCEAATYTNPTATPLIPSSGVSVLGITPRVTFGSNPNTIPDSPLSQLTGGTIFDCNGTDGFAWNLTALGVPASQLVFSQSALTNITIKGIGFINCATPIHAGATNNGSAWYSVFEDLYSAQPTGWHINLNNFQHIWVERQRTYGPLTGMMLFNNDVPAATLQPGNSTFIDLFGVTGSPGLLVRGICHNVVQGVQNQAFHARIQANKQNVTPSIQAATMVNAQATFNVTDGTKFPLTMPVSFQSTANGFTASKIYFVVSSAGNTISVANTVGGAAINATGNTAINIITQGYAPFEMIALAGGTFNNQEIHNLDVEGGGTCAILMQNKSSLLMGISQLPLTTQSTQGLCCRNVLNSIILSPNGTNTDFDNSASQAITYIGTRAGVCVGTMGQGVYTDSVSGNISLSLGAIFDTQSKGVLTYQPGTNNQNIGNSIAVQPTLNGNAGPTLTQTAGIVGFSTSGTTITLPTFTAASAGEMAIVNTTVGTQTITTQGGQLFNGIAGRTTLTLPTGASVKIGAAQFPGGTFGPIILGASGAIVAGAVTAPT